MGIFRKQLIKYLLIKTNSMNKAILLTSGAVILIVFFLYSSFEEKSRMSHGNEVQIIETWELPDILQEVSGIAYLGDERMACIQDEDGVIFIYDLSKRKIVNEIKFAGSGDYESITLANENAYVLRSDGTIFEILNFLEENPQTIEHTTSENFDRNFEGLEYDEKNKRLLMALKERSGKIFRPIFSFDLSKERMEEDPVIKITFSDTLFSSLGKNPSEKFLKPSEITIHPQTNKIFILEGVNPKILILDENGNPERIYLLNKKQFRQAEGLTFGENGEVYISNEGNGAPPNILQISLN